MLVIPAILALMFSGCTKEDIFNTYEIGFEETVNHNKALEVTFSSIDDSRCPTDVVCVWEGQADVELTAFFEEDDAPTIFHLISRAGYPALADTLLNGYHFQLLDVDPYPDHANSPPAAEDYTIRLLIEGQ